MVRFGISSAQNADSASGGIVFDRLAPLPAPRFTARAPQSKAEAEVHLKKHTESMTRLRICDLDGEGGDALFSRPSRAVDGNDAKAYAKGKGKPSSLGHGLGTRSCWRV
jgi:mitosis inhibitor protein kinase SWE1